ncbi:hypothetical protein EVJ58_g6305 [Rhodofomes roseus]|uniref:CoA-transferase family III n=1 Tax=Rhodofomes roseus TaxID=34475 RepID=A0A4Y9YAN6_9APHY|nr:hypothetical protein EVJ58_g6305 [Rhodofomes roseus]
MLTRTCSKLNKTGPPLSSVKRLERTVTSCRRFITSQGNALQDLPLSGIRVLEIGQVIAGPFCGQLLGHYGAEVIKVEPPNVGDPLRVWRELDVDGVSPWWRSIARNKKSVTIDLRKEEGRDLVRKLAIKSDVLLENFKPGTLEKWKLGPEDLHPHNPSLIFTRVSGYGQTGPWASRPGYASVCEAQSGFRYINGYPDPETGMLDGPPVRPNISLGDSVAGLHAALGTVLALLSRKAKEARGQVGGQTVDVSILESMMNLMEGIIPEYDRKGKIRGPSGSSVTGIVPTNAYPCKPSPSSPDIPSFIVIGANADSMYQEIEDAISSWTREHTAEEVEEVLQGVGVPSGRVLSVKEIVDNPQVKARGLVEEVWVGDEAREKGWNVKMPKVTPVLEGCDTKTRWAGPDLGQHNREVLVGELGLSEAELTRLQEDGIIGQC